MGISIIGIGGAGGNVANLWAKKGYLAGAINFSEKDLESLDHVDYKCRLIGSDGVGHVREEAIRLVSEHPEMAIDFIKNHFANQKNDIIIFTFATGGGSGSGIVPILLEICVNKFTDNTFVAMPIIPSQSESVIAQLNTIKALEELNNSNVCVLPIDNQQIKTKLNSAAKHKIYEYSNSTVVELLDKLQSFTDMYSQRGNFDSKDLINLFSTPGFATISETDITKIKANEEFQLSNENVSKIIQNSWKNTIFVPISYEKVFRSAFILQGQEQLLEFIDYDNVYSTFKNGSPLDIFEGIYPDKNGYIMTVLVGLSNCDQRIEVIESIINDKKEGITNILNNDNKFTVKQSTSDIMMSLKKPNKKPTKSMSDILSQYKR